MARFTDLSRSVGGFPDSDVPGCERTLLDAIGFDPPDELGDGSGADDDLEMSPVGAKASQASAVPVSEGFNLGFADCLPGSGVMTHHHDTNETFVVMQGRWRFTCLESRSGAADEPTLLMVVVAGNAPKAFMRPDFLAEARRTGKFTPMWDRANA